MDWYSDPNPSGRQDWSKLKVNDLKRKLITANHILHYHSVVDAYGHISIRHPGNPEIYIMCGYMAPGVVSTADDLIEYWVKDSSTVDPKAKKGYAERFIHGEMFSMFQAVNCVVHSHAEAVLPYVTSGVPLLPVFHMAGFLGERNEVAVEVCVFLDTHKMSQLGKDVPVWDVGKMYQPGEQQDLLVRNSRIGTGLASSFRKDASSHGPSPDHTVVLMRRHGYTTHGVDIESAVYRAIYTKINAGVQTNATMIRHAFPQVSGMENKFEFEPLTDDMCEGCTKMNEGTQDKPWRLWVAEVEKSSLYVNRG